MENSQSFWQFSDQLRTQNNNLANLSLNDSIWSNSYASKRLGERRNFDIRVGGNVNPPTSLVDNLKSDFNGFNHGWKIGLDYIGIGSVGDVSTTKDMLDVGINGGFNKGVYSSQPLNYNKSKGYYNSNSNSKNSNVMVNAKANKNGKFDDEHGHVGKKKNKANKDSSENCGKNSVEKRFKTLPPSEALPRNETIGGYIFVCNNDTMQENLKRQLFGLPPRYRDSVRAITPGLPLFLYNYSTHQLHGIFEAASFGGTNIDPKAWEDKKNPGESRFPAQVRVLTRKICDPLDEDAFRPILHHYDGPKFRLELSVPEALSLLDIFAETSP